MPIPSFASASAHTSPGEALDTLHSSHRAKRKRNAETPEPLSRHQSAPADPSSSSSLPPSKIAAEEYRTAGQPFNQDLHPFPFPHAPVKETSGATPSPRRKEALSSLDSEASSETPKQSDEDGAEAVAKPKSSSNASLRQQHYTVLTCLLHRCLLKNDHIRASRAWAMLLRLEDHGHPLDFRAQERWGIGAELLLHGNSNDDAQLNLENLMRARDYYERLILQYPYRKYSPDTVSSLTFYPVMFGIWIYSIQLRYKVTGRESVQRSKHDGNPETNYPHVDEDADSSAPNAQTTVQIEARRVAVEQANEVVKKLGELVISPPYSDHSGLWKIQGMLYLWLSQLLDRNRVPSKAPSQSLDSDEEYPKEEPQARQKAIRKANEAFSRALKAGGTIDIKIQEEVGLKMHDSPT
ncbi:MAG: hypothetical protein Q9172_002845 [Xanthocarpia lactea]